MEREGAGVGESCAAAAEEGSTSLPGEDGEPLYLCDLKTTGTGAATVLSPRCVIAFHCERVEVPVVARGSDIVREEGRGSVEGGEDKKSYTSKNDESERVVALPRRSREVLPAKERSDLPILPSETVDLAARAPQSALLSPQPAAAVTDVSRRRGQRKVNQRFVHSGYCC